MSCRGLRSMEVCVSRDIPQEVKYCVLSYISQQAMSPTTFPQNHLKYEVGHNISE